MRVGRSAWSVAGRQGCRAGHRVVHAYAMMIRHFILTHTTSKPPAVLPSARQGLTDLGGAYLAWPACRAYTSHVTHLTSLTQ